MHLRLSSLLLSIIAVATACANREPFAPQPYELPTGAPVHVGVAPQGTGKGAVVEVTVTNRGEQVYSWNPCFRALERLQDGVWQVVAEGERVCTEEAWLLGRGKVQRGQTTLGVALPAGQYRFRYPFSPEPPRAGEWTPQVSNTFIAGGTDLHLFTVTP